MNKWNRFRKPPKAGENNNTNNFYVHLTRTINELLAKGIFG